VLLDDFDNPVGTRVDQNRATVHDRVAIVPNAIFLRHIIIGYALLRQNRANPDILAILIGRAVLLNDITAKARTLIDAENAGYSADHAADDTANHGADRTGRSFTVSRSALDPTGNSLALRGDRQRHGGDNGSYSDKAANHDISKWCWVR
jgi:hypothetical protein